MDKYRNDPFMNRERVKERLRGEFEKYGKLIIAYDFDYTVHNYRDEEYTYEFVSNLLRGWKPYARFIVFSASPKSRYEYIAAYLTEKEIPFNVINDEVLERDYTRKIYYNVFLDDRAGLGETAEILSELLDEIKAGTLHYTPKSDDYSYFGEVTPYMCEVIDRCRRNGLTDKEIAVWLEEF